MNLFDRVTSQTTLLTPNRRLAAVFSKKYAQEQSKRNITCWQTLDILPLYPSWLERLWKNASAQDISNKTLLLTTRQEQILWEKIIRDAPENESLLQLSDTAKFAKSAWETLKRWRVNLNDSSLTLTEDSRAFLQWAASFKTLCEKNDWLDQNTLADKLINKIISKDIIPPQHIILVGFTEIAPQYQHLLDICEQNGSLVEHYSTPSRNHTAQQIPILDAENEIRTMARWAKSLVNESQASIACIVPSLEKVRDRAIQIFSDVLGKNKFNISAGKSLISYPIIHDALQLLNLNKKSISFTTLSSLLRSPFLGEAEQERYKRAFYDARLRNLNITSLSLEQLLEPESKHSLMNACPALANRVQHFVTTLENQERLLPISQWIIIFSDLLTKLGWPGQRSLNSHEYQVVQNAWLPLLSEYATFDSLMGPQTYQKALHYLICLASNTVFQPESPETSVQILGLLEAAELPFEHAWVMGLDDTTWPSKPKPNPFIPLSLQKALSMPNASADRELLYCQQLTKQLHYSSAHIIFSYPTQRDNAELRPSSLLKNYEKILLDQLNLYPFTSFSEKIYQTQALDYLTDEMAPALLEMEKIHGGVKIFKSQAECPFKAFAELRLHAKKMEEASIGLRKLDRGNIVHKALELIWRQLNDSNALILKSDDELKALIRTATQQAIADIVDNHTGNNTRYLILEHQRHEKLLWDWLQLEKQRPAFTVIALEQEITTTIGNLTAHFRVDRIDELTSETTAAKQLIIDYKTGKNLSKTDWFGARLNEPQLPIYCIANPDQTIGIAFAKVNPHSIEMMGASRSPLKIDAIAPLSDIKQADANLWQEQLHAWQTNLTKLANDFYQGNAQVDPKQGELTCRLCGLQPLCRIHELTDVDEEYENNEPI